METSVSTPIVIVSVLAITCWALLRQKRHQYSFPPGPSPKPIIGNALDIPAHKPWLTYMKWSKEMNSTILGLKTMNMNMIVLHKIKDAQMLLDKRSSIYSDRPVLPVVKLLAVDTLSSLLAYGKDWRKHRQLYTEGLRKSIMPSYAQLQTEKVNLLLEQLLDSPTKFREHFK
ncbi:hypothetical protein AX14_008203, partial [Amanita brunnescens Koide BX004]